VSEEYSSTFSICSKRGFTNKIGWKRFGKLYIEWTLWDNSIEILAAYDGLFGRKEGRIEVPLNEQGGEDE